ncbi:MAG: NADH-quinone oxidoreductase subunit NuoG [Chloroflexota bacterium]|nr:NADH-quinone oxidoreductase subunit NuoG [Chloroflexota bacterium]
MTQQTPDTVTLTINGQTMVAPKGMLLVEAAKLVGLEIPIFCYHPKLKPVGACRMCLVQIEKLPRLQTACTTPVASDMIVHTNTPDVVAAQNGVLELMLANHPLDCPICDKGGECPLQDNTFAYGPGASRFTEEKRHKEKAFPLGEGIVLDRERCIMCYRCVRFHQEIPGDEALAAVSRGADSEIATLDGEPYNSIFAGNTIELCPVGALTSRQYRFKARPWDLVRTPSVCNGCAVGCNVEVHSRTETVLRLVARDNPAVNDGWLCDPGRFGTIPMPQAGRPTRPMLRQSNGVLAPVTWDQALRKAADVLRQGGGIVASADLSNEAFWLLQRMAPELPAALLPATPADTWPVQGTLENLSRCKTIVLVGLDAWNDLPVLALRIREAVQSGAKLVVLGQTNGLWRDTTHWLRGEPLASVESLVDALESSASKGPPSAVTAVAEAVRGVFSKDPPAEVAAAADALGGQPVALLAHPSLVPSGRALLESLAAALGANGATGMLGAPLLGANARGAQEFAPDLVRGELTQVLGSTGLLVIGDPPWMSVHIAATRLVLATAQPLPQDPRLEVVLPMAHAYERQATLTNLEGRIQHQEGGAAPLPHARADWGIVAGLAQRLGRSPALESLRMIRSLMADQHPSYVEALHQEALTARV